MLLSLHIYIASLNEVISFTNNTFYYSISSNLVRFAQFQYMSAKMAQHFKLCLIIPYDKPVNYYCGISPNDECSYTISYECLLPDEDWW